MQFVSYIIVTPGLNLELLFLKHFQIWHIACQADYTRGETTVESRDRDPNQNYNKKESPLIAMLFLLRHNQYAFLSDAINYWNCILLISHTVQLVGTPAARGEGCL